MTERGSANYLSAREVYDFRPYTPAFAHATRPLYERVRHVIPEIEWAFFALCARNQSPQAAFISSFAMDSPRL